MGNLSIIKLFILLNYITKIKQCQCNYKLFIAILLDAYILSIITITSNIDLIVYENDEKNTTNKTVINEEFFSTNLNKDIKKFCLNQSGDYNGVTNSYIYSSIYFQILGVENGKKVQYTNAPLINGLSVEQTLEKDEILYYRLNDYLEGSNQINIYLKKLEGEINLYKYICENIFNYSFYSKDFNATNQINFTDNNYINRMDGINNTENIYHKLSGNKLEKLNKSICENNLIYLSVPIIIIEDITKEIIIQIITTIIIITI